MRVGLEDPVDEEHVGVGLDDLLDDLPLLETGCPPGLGVGDLDALEVGRADDALGGVPLDHPRHVDAGHRLQVGPDDAGVLRLAGVIELDFEGAGDLFVDDLQVHLGDEDVEERHRQPEHEEVAGQLHVDVRVLHLEGDVLAVPGPRPMDLAEARRGDRLVGDGLEDLVRVRAELLLEMASDALPRQWVHPILEALQAGDPLGGHDVHPSGDDLADLDEPALHTHRRLIEAAGALHVGPAPLLGRDFPAEMLVTDPEPQVREVERNEGGEDQQESPGGVPNASHGVLGGVLGGGGTLAHWPAWDDAATGESHQVGDVKGL